VPSAMFIVHSNPVEGREDEYNEWYNTKHLDDIFQIAGFVSARRYRISEAQYAPFTKFRYIATYEIEGDPAVSMNALKKAIDDGLHLSDALDPELLATLYEPITDWISPK